MENSMYAIIRTVNYKIIKVAIERPDIRHDEFVSVHTIDENEERSLWPKISYLLHKSNMFATKDQAVKELFIRQLKGK